MSKHLISVFSNSFKNTHPIPQKNTCDCQDISPHISWTNIPKLTKSLIVMAYDKDIPFRGISLFTWVHWLVYNISPEITELKEGFPSDAAFENGIKQGITTFKKAGYGGPCPPFGTHRYFFKVLAIDTKIDLDTDVTTWKKIKNAIKGHILAEGEMYGVYSRQKKHHLINV